MIASSFSYEMAYEVPDGDELDEFRAEVETLLQWLGEHEFQEHDIIRAALIEGLKKFLFDIKYVNFVGWLAPIGDFKQIIVAYKALENLELDADVNNVAKAAAVKVKSLVVDTYNKIKLAKDVTAVARWTLDIYGGAHLYLSHAPEVSGYLSHLAK